MVNDPTKIKVTLNHDRLVCMFCGRAVPPGGPYTRYTGNQWREDWEWDKDAVRSITTLDLAKKLFGDNYEVVDE